VADQLPRCGCGGR